MPVEVVADRAGAVRSAAHWQPGAYAGPAPVSAVTAHITGTGTVRSRTGQAFVGGTTETSVLRGDWLELSATASAGHTFTGWSGACAGQRGRTCLVQARSASLTAGASFS